MDSESMRTKHKIAIAKLAYHLVHLARSSLQKGDLGRFNRNGAIYELDLKQGIDFSLYLLGSFEPSTRKALKRLVKPGSNVLDIGANIGAHTLGLARLVGPTGKVVACEPTDFAFGKLKKNLSLNPDLAKRVLALQCFLGAPERTELPAQIYSGWPLAGGADLHPEHLGSEETSLNATSRSLDDVVRACDISRVDLIKMDVDGFECDVLSGASATLARDKPIFVMEIAPYVLAERGRSVKELLSYFEKYGYKFFSEKDFSPLVAGLKSIVDSIKAGESINVIAKAS